MRLFHLFSGLLALLLFTSCPADVEFTPAFVTVDGFELTTSGGQGAATTDITEVWVSIGGDFLGVFPLPARIPVPRVGQVTLRLEAGVRQDGRSATPEVYPFYTEVSRQLDLVSGEAMNLGTLPIRYRDNATFGFVEDFETGNRRVFVDRIAGNSFLQTQSEVVRSGGAAGAIALADSNRLVELATNVTFSGLNEIPISAWLEVDYRSDAPAVFGVAPPAGSSLSPVFNPGFLPRGEWTKIYFNLDFVIATSDFSELRVALSTLLGEELDRGTVYLDNLKLIYF